MLNALKEQTQGIEQDISKGVQTTTASDLRIRQNLLNTLQRKFVEVMKEYQAAQAKYKTEIVKRPRGRCRLSNLTQQTRKWMGIRSGGADKLIQEQILTGEANESIKFMASNINDRYNEIIAIEASVQELHQLFLDMALLVEQQGELRQHRIPGSADGRACGKGQPAISRRHQAHAKHQKDTALLLLCACYLRYCGDCHYHHGREERWRARFPPRPYPRSHKSPEIYLNLLHHHCI